MNSLAELGEISKASMSEENKNRLAGAATGAGAIGTGVGLAGGGIPGTKSTRIAADWAGPGVKLKDRPGNLWRSRRAGAFGMRTNAHQTLRDFELSEEGAKHHYPKDTSRDMFMRAAQRGKDIPEEKIVEHMKAGRKGSTAALVAGVPLLAGGVGYKAHQKYKQKQQGFPQPLTKADDDYKSTALLTGGALGAGGSYGAARALEHQGRRWAAEGEKNLAEAQRIMPEVGGYTKKKGRVPSVRAETKTKDIPEHAFHGKPKEVIQAAGHHHGMGTNQAYFAHVYNKMGRGMRYAGVPAGLAATGAGAYGLNQRRKRERSG